MFSHFKESQLFMGSKLEIQSFENCFCGCETCFRSHGLFVVVSGGVAVLSGLK